MSQASEPKVLDFPPGGGDEPPTSSDVPAPEGGGIPDKWDPQKNGTILAHIDGLLYRLRRPRAGEYRRIREHVVEIRDRGIDNTIRRARAIAAVTEGHEPEVPPEEIPVDQDGEILGVMRLVFNGGELDGKPFRGLSDRSLPDDDDELPTWFLADAFLGEMLDHWRSVP